MVNNAKTVLENLKNVLLKALKYVNLTIKYIYKPFLLFCMKCFYWIGESNDLMRDLTRCCNLT